MSRRVGPFMAVGALGFVWQATSLTLLTDAGWPLAAATLAAVETAILHNFCWHECWTWRNRATDVPWIARLARFHALTGITSICANLIITMALAGVCRFPPVLANTVAVALMSAINFWVVDRWVFARATPQVLTVAVVGVLAAHPAHAQPPGEAVTAWNAYVAQIEAARDRQPSIPCSPGAPPRGESLGVRGGIIHRWSGCTVVKGASVETIVDGLLHPGTPPPQPDVLDARVLSRTGDSLHVYLRIVRRTILTVTYDTEHDVTFSRLGPGIAVSRSIATRIVEAGESIGSGESRRSSEADRGFLWKLNSYWRYTQTDEDVRIELESISLSRSIPALLWPVASPLIARVARESITRALDAVRLHFRSDASGQLRSADRPDHNPGGLEAAANRR
jgi:putative flippase GtrA